MSKFIFLITLSSFNYIFAMEVNNDSKWDAKLYDQHSKPQYKACLKNLSKFDLSSDDFKTIVELGCHTANVSNKFAKKYPDKKFIGIDPEKNAIKFGKAKHKKRKNLTLICDSAQKFDLENHNMPLANLLVCYHVMHWIPRNDLQQVFNNVALNLDKDGILDISTSAKQGATGLTKAVLRTILKFKWLRYLPYCIKKVIKGQNNLTLLTVNELAQFATQAGLNIDNCEETEAIYQFDSKEKFCPWLASILKPYGTDTVLKERQEEFVDEVAELYCKEYNPGKNGNIEYKFKELHLTAHK